MATILQVLQQTAARLGIPAPAAYNSNTRLLALLQELVEDIRSLRTFPQQKRTHSFSTSNGTSEYALPADFYTGLLDVAYDQSENWQLVGPLSDGDFNYRLYGPGASSSRFHYRVFGPTIDQYSSAKMLKLNPTPSDTRTISYDYLTRSLFLPAAWTPADTAVYETFTASTNVMMFDEDLLKAGLIYYFREFSGLDYAEHKRKYDRLLSKAATQWTGPYRGKMDGTGRNVGKFGYPSDGGW